MNRLLSTTLTLFLTSYFVYGQNIFPQKVEGCNTAQFCLDCGEPKAVFDTESFKVLSDNLNSKYNFKGGKGKTSFQVLVDTLGTGCVLSHTDATSNKLTNDIIAFLNNCKWVPAKEQNRPVTSSINVFFEIKNDKLEGGIQRINIDEITENMKNPGTPEIYNKHYKYENLSLDKYEITVWQKGNSRLPNDMGRLSIVDKDDVVWVATYNGFARFDGNQFTRLNESNSPFKKDESLQAIGIDSRNNKWVYTSESIFKFDNTKWHKLDSIEIGVKDANNIIGHNNGEVLFCSDKGLLILKNNKQQFLNKANIKELPSNSIDFAYRDKKNRLWIGTFKGSIMVDASNKVTEFNKTSTPLNNICITGATEDNDGNIYFSLYAYKKSSERNRVEEGIAVFTKDGKWIHYNDTNSGMPANHVNHLLFDKFENVLWIGTNEAGLVRFDLKDNWENYHNHNSKVPSSYIFNISQDSKGNLYVSTFYGLMRIRKK
jgi:hypothetical protein